MIALAQPDDPRRRKPGPRRRKPAWHKRLLAMLPTVRRNAKLAFRRLDAESREDAVAEVIANVTAAFARLVKLGKAHLAFPTVLTRYAISQFRDGRRVGNRFRISEVLSRHAQRKKGFSSNAWTIAGRIPASGTRPSWKIPARPCPSRWPSASIFPTGLPGCPDGTARSPRRFPWETPRAKSPSVLISRPAASVRCATNSTVPGGIFITIRLPLTE